MKKVLFAMVMVSSVTAAYSSEFNLETITAADLGVKIEAAAVPVPAATLKDAAQDQLARFRQVANELNMIQNDLTWVRNDMDTLESRARQMIQTNSQDAFFQMDLMRMKSDMSRRFDNLQRAARDVKGLLAGVQRSADLNKAAKDMEWASRDILSETWPMLENSAQRLESTIRFAKPEIVGYNAQWDAMDISRFTRQLSDQARSAAYDAQALVTQTQP
jgi:hypothetical protein